MGQKIWLEESGIQQRSLVCSVVPAVLTISVGCWKVLAGSLGSNAPGLLTGATPELMRNRMAEVGRNLWRSLSLRLLLQQGHPEQAAHVQVPFEDLQEGESTASLGTLYQCSVTHLEKKCFLVLRETLYQIVPMAFCPLKKAWLHPSFTLPSKYL